jgi:hypothetical protein
MPESTAANKRAQEPPDAKKIAIRSAANDLKKKLADFSKDLKRAKAVAGSDEEKELLDLRIRVVDNLAEQIGANCIVPNFGRGFLREPCKFRHKKKR